MPRKSLEVRTAIDELRLSLRSGRDEIDLLKKIEDGVARLRQSYRQDPDAFAEDDVQYLRGLAPVSRALRSFLEEKRRRDLEARIFELNQTPRRCRRGHRMAIRQGERGTFWGCTAYPFCHHTTLLSLEEWAYLAGEERYAPRGLANARQLALV